jgi:fermentation-respiration switch protein FrsA (DUF1100 family)
MLALLCTVGACTHAGNAGVSRPHMFERRIDLENRPLTLHLSPAVPLHRDELIVYATGDGGWRGKDVELFHQLQAWGYAAAGFSASEYLKDLPGDDGMTTPDVVAVEFGTIIDAARGALSIAAASPVVLVGVSRGADLAVVAAGQATLQAQLGGVVAVALTREEEYVRHDHEPVLPIELYPYLPQLGDIPLSVIQSTRDNYLPAGEARELFGKDTPLRVLHAVDARNHSFGGSRDRLYSTLRSSLAWVERIGRGRN